MGNLLTNLIGAVVRTLQFQRQSFRDEVELLVEHEVHLEFVIIIMVRARLAHGISHRRASTEWQYTSRLALSLQDIVHIVVGIRDTGDDVFAIDESRAAEW